MTNSVSRRRALQGAAATAALPLVALAQPRPGKLVFLGGGGAGWNDCLVEEVAPAFEKETGIKVEFTMLPIDALAARLKAELNSGSAGVDIIQWLSSFAGWLAPHMEDHDRLLAAASSRHADFDWDDFASPVREMASYQGKLLAIPYRVASSILHYQKQLLADGGIPHPPGSWDELLRALEATTKPPGRYGLGIWGRQGPAIVDGFAPFLLGNGGRFFDPVTREVLVNSGQAVEALAFYGDLMTLHKVVVPDAITWEFAEIIAGGQRDRYAMAVTLAPYGGLINDPKQSLTGGRWAWALAPGRHGSADSSVNIGGWSTGVAKTSKNKEWAFDFIQMAASKRWLRRSMERGNSPPRISVLTDPSVRERHGWAPVMAESLKTAQLAPRDPVWPGLELPLRGAISAVLLGEKKAKQALDQVASDWERTLKRTGVKPG